ncbi:hypothetical protein, variant [Exophiala mesophila]|uniref:AMP-activated protein kinase glycogen-binding domain-containing protein n=1 Tax=Exophiala mesophila TaxID=212818 RepID=A0A0D1X328_EXOME|nr:hypothetical protein, variant [Exophiala mesophila]KIV96175.1 hypothetical protein, variant [Exophiala mesophila]
MGSFVFRWPHPDANDVHVTGTFDDWSKSEQLLKVGEIWEKDVQLADAEKKILYKFVVNDNWVIDPNAPQEDDGHGNLNNVLYPDQIIKKSSGAPETVTTSSAAPDSTTAALAGAVPLEPAKEAAPGDLPGTFPETPQQEPQTVSVNPLPATSGDGNPITIPAGEQLPPASDITASAIDSKVTTSKEDYEKAGQEEPESFSVKPIPASAGPGNPVDLPAGEPVPASGEVSANSVQSTVTTSKEDYEKAGSSVPFIGGAIAGVGAAGLGAAAFASSDKKENLIPESSLPLGADAGNTLDAGPTISSAAPVSTTAELAGKVPLEERKEAAIVHGNRETTDTVPEVVKESIAEAHTSPEATTSAEAVKEKAEVEQELLKKVPSSEEVGEPAPVATATTSSTAPAAALGTTSAPGVSPAAGAALSDGAEDPSLADEPAVQYLKQNDGAADTPATEATPAAEAPAESQATEAPKEAAKAEPTPGTPSKKTEPAASATPATPTSTSKKPAMTPTSTSSPASASKEKKKKHRISSLFKKIFD